VVHDVGEVGRAMLKVLEGRGERFILESREINRAGR
jgi:hypothetical protein